MLEKAADLNLAAFSQATYTSEDPRAWEERPPEGERP